jgi:hypothetical protein
MSIAMTAGLVGALAGALVAAIALPRRRSTEEPVVVDEIEDRVSP